MSTEYAVQMDLPDFFAAAAAQGFKLEVVNENGYNRPRLVDGSPRGYVYDPREEAANDGKTWTMFTRFAGADVSRLAGPLGACDENSPEFDAIYGDMDDRAERNIKLAVGELFADHPATLVGTRWLLEKVLEFAQVYRDLKRPWAAADEQDLLPIIYKNAPHE